MFLSWSVIRCTVKGCGYIMSFVSYTKRLHKAADETVRIQLCTDSVIYLEMFLL